MIRYLGRECRGALRSPFSYIKTTMEPLQELFDLYESMVGQPKPPLKDPGEPTIGTPNFRKGRSDLYRIVRR